MKFKNRFWIAFLFLLVVPWASDAQNCYDKPSQTGPCKAAFPSWRFIRHKRLCEFFLYGGCQATGNIFDTEEDCRKLCLG